ncbi:LysE family translocator [Kocuria palustris]|nr:LysE family transporter [Kocuria palustris]
MSSGRSGPPAQHRLRRGGLRGGRGDRTADRRGASRADRGDSRGGGLSDRAEHRSPAGPAPRCGLAGLVGATGAALAAPNGRSIIRQGATVSALNAKSLVFFVAFLPLFVSPSAAPPPPPLWVQLVVLGLTWAAMAAVFNLVLGLASRRLLTGQPTAAGIISRITGIAMVVMGL